MCNLFSATKDIVGFQQNYTVLFSRYSSLGADYAQQELENILTLVNVWRYVMDNQPKGNAIAYDAKRRYRKSTDYFNDALVRMKSEIKGEFVRSEQYVYLIDDFDISQDNILENRYLNIVLQIRKRSLTMV